MNNILLIIVFSSLLRTPLLSHEQTKPQTEDQVYRERLIGKWQNTSINMRHLGFDYFFLNEDGSTQIINTKDTIIGSWSLIGHTLEVKLADNSIFFSRSIILKDSILTMWETDGQRCATNSTYKKIKTL